MRDISLRGSANLACAWNNLSDVPANQGQAKLTTSPFDPRLTSKHDCLDCEAVTRRRRVVLQSSALGGLANERSLKEDPEV